MPYESNLWTWLREGTRKLYASKALDICRVENSISAGYPDVEGCYHKIGFHIELKGANRPKRTTTGITINIKVEQINWLERRWEVGGNCYVLLRVGTHSSINIYLFPGNNVEFLKNKPTEDELKASSVCPIKPTPQDIIALVCERRELPWFPWV